jgi:hypothetical protein
MQPGTISPSRTPSSLFGRALEFEPLVLAGPGARDLNLVKEVAEAMPTAGDDRLRSWAEKRHVARPLLIRTCPVDH